MLGQIAPCGTGDCEVLLDNDAVERLMAPVALDVGAPRSAAQQQLHNQQQQQQQQLQRRGRAAGEGAAPVLELPDIMEEGEESEGDASDTEGDADLQADELQFV